MAKDKESTYYDVGGIEVIDIIKAKLTEEQFQGWQLGQAITYLCRAQWKHRNNPLEQSKDLRKAANYANWMADDIDNSLHKEEEKQ